jgi:hypothetical protein
LNTLFVRGVVAEALKLLIVSSSELMPITAVIVKT